NRIARVRPRADEIAQRVGRRIDRDAHDVDARHHHLPRLEIAEFEELVENVSGLAAQEAALLALLDDHLQLLGRVVALLFSDVAFHADGAQYHVADAVERAHDGHQRYLQPFDERRYPERGARRALERERLRHHL